MKRFGKAILDPTHVRAVAPATPAGIAGFLERTPGGLVPLAYTVLFFDGSTITLDAESALPLMTELVGVAPEPAPPPVSRPPQPDRVHQHPTQP